MQDYWLDMLLRWLHILPAIVLGGGLFFWRIVLVPAVGSSIDQEWFPQMRAIWARTVGICTALLLVSGLVNAIRNINGYEFKASGYHAWVAVKLLLGIAVFALAALICGRSHVGRRMQQRLSYWLTVTIVITLIVVLVGGVMRSMGRTPKAKASTVTVG